MEKIKVDLYVKGSILIDNNILQISYGNTITSFVSIDDKRYDLSNAIIIDGDLRCNNITLNSDKIIVASKSIVTHCNKSFPSL